MGEEKGPGTKDQKPTPSHHRSGLRRLVFYTRQIWVDTGSQGGRYCLCRSSGSAGFKWEALVSSSKTWVNSKTSVRINKAQE